MPREPLNVAASIIADISAGIYRSPAGALKELISNAFDADAPSVRISTGWPKFKTFTCTDDGRGMKPDEFREIMGHIGGSAKRDAGELSPKLKRPLIGRIGIGLLSIAQICRKFTVFSSVEGEGRKFRAEIDLEPYLLAEARRKLLGQTLQTEQGKVKIGEYEIEETEEAADKHYTRIVMENIDEGFQKRLTDIPQERAGFTPKRFTEGRIEDFLKIVESGTVAEHGAYAQMVWELAVAAPVQYMEGGPIRGTHELDDLKQRLEGYKFKAYVDGVELRKPILLPQRGASSIEHKVYQIRHEGRLSGDRRLALRGYLYWQKGRILPRELQGILVRVRNVAIGQYDPTYLGYPHHEGWKFSQMTGELCVDEGLDPAVNIDRASFRESDEAFLELQGFLFEKLQKGGTDEGGGIFTDIKRETGEIRKRSRRKAEERRAKAVSRLAGGPARAVPIERVEAGDAPAGVSFQRGAVKIQEDLIDRVPRKHRELFVAVCRVIESEVESTISRDKRRKIYEKIAELLGEF
ncbi:MAG: ATP-binding protein [Vicinamibacteria bacterium]